MMEKCIKSKDFEICTGKDPWPGRMCLYSAGEQQGLKSVHELSLSQQLIPFSMMTGSLEVGGKEE